ncbi:MAG: multidrug transporter [Desulfuromonadales bacterium C00003068]|nr:MAG: multidrug transporter [Desulfuromonadales bacterium C00003068]
MKKRPFIIALLVLCVIFAIFVGLMKFPALLSSGATSFSLGNKVGVVELRGAIADSKNTIEQLVVFAKDDSIKAIVLRVDSPGGGVGPSQEIYSEVARITQDKPIIVSMGSVAASGGYYVAAPANKIFANPGTITGSIGVIMEFTNVLALMDKIGLKTRVVKSGMHKDIGSSVREMTVEEQALLQGLIDDVHSQFVAAVSEGRNLSEEEVRKLADGRIFTGKQALRLGLIDELGGLRAAIFEAARQGGIVGEPNIVYPEEPSVSLIDYFVGTTLSKVEQFMMTNQTTGLQVMWSPAN